MEGGLPKVPAGAGKLAAKLFLNAVVDEEARLSDLKRFDGEYSALQERIASLTDKTRHGVMVPYGKVAFFPGELIHTNELLVHLGDSYYVEASAMQAGGIIDRRRTFLGDKIAAAEEGLRDMRARAGFAGESSREEEEGGFEIVEEYDEAIHGDGGWQPAPAPARAPAAAAAAGGGVSEDEFEDVLAKLERLEALEEERGDDDDDDTEAKEVAVAVGGGAASPAAPGRAAVGPKSILKKGLLGGRPGSAGGGGQAGGAGEGAPMPAPAVAAPAVPGAGEAALGMGGSSAFTGRVVERPAGAGAGPGAPGAGDAPPRRVSKFKQQRM